MKTAHQRRSVASDSLPLSLPDMLHNVRISQLVFSKVKANLGLDETTLFFTAAAPIAKEVRKTQSNSTAKSKHRVHFRRPTGSWQLVAGRWVKSLSDGVCIDISTMVGRLAGSKELHWFRRRHHLRESNVELAASAPRMFFFHSAGRKKPQRVLGPSLPRFDSG